MSERVTVMMTDDLEELRNPGSDVLAVGTVRFAFEGKAYEIDLSAGNGEAFYEALRPWIEAARPVKDASARRQQKPGKHARQVRHKPAATTEEIRQWARLKGHPVKDRGRIPESIMADYRKEMPAPA